MPFPDPFLPLLLIMVVGSWLVSQCFRFSPKPQPSAPSHPAGAMAEPHADDNPFADNAAQDPVEPAPVRITTKFVEIGSGTEELAFDWIAEPFGLRE